MTYKIFYSQSELDAGADSLPDSLTTLELVRCTSLAALPDSLPDSLTTLELWDCTSLAALPDSLPDSLTTLELVRCTSLVDRIYCGGLLIVSDIPTKYTMCLWLKNNEAIYCAGCFSGNYDAAIKRARGREDYLKSIKLVTDVHAEIKGAK